MKALIEPTQFQAVALAFREATYCSSGEDSDNSHSSRGSLGQTSSNGSTLAEDLNIIERTMVREVTDMYWAPVCD